MTGPAFQLQGDTRHPTGAQLVVQTGDGWEAIAYFHAVRLDPLGQEQYTATDAATGDLLLTGDDLNLMVDAVLRRWAEARAAS